MGNVSWLGGPPHELCDYGEVAVLYCHKMASTQAYRNISWLWLAMIYNVAMYGDGDCVGKSFIMSGDGEDTSDLVVFRGWLLWNCEVMGHIIGLKHVYIDFSSVMNVIVFF